MSFRIWMNGRNRKREKCVRERRREQMGADLRWGFILSLRKVRSRERQYPSCVVCVRVTGDALLPKANACGEMERLFPDLLRWRWWWWSVWLWWCMHTSVDVTYHFHASGGVEMWNSFWYCHCHSIPNLFRHFSYILLSLFNVKHLCFFERRVVSWGVIAWLPLCLNILVCVLSPQVCVHWNSVVAVVCGISMLYKLIELLWSLWDSFFFSFKVF